MWFVEFLSSCISLLSLIILVRSTNSRLLGYFSLCEAKWKIVQILQKEAIQVFGLSILVLIISYLLSLSVTLFNIVASFTGLRSGVSLGELFLEICKFTNALFAILIVNSSTYYFNEQKKQNIVVFKKILYKNPHIASHSKVKLDLSWNKIFINFRNSDNAIHARFQWENRIEYLRISFHWKELVWNGQYWIVYSMSLWNSFFISGDCFLSHLHNCSRSNLYGNFSMIS